MKSFWRAVVLAIVIAVFVAIAAWATAPRDRTVPPPLVPVMGERPATIAPAVDGGPNYVICGELPCAVP